ncbi:MAG: hypothetical protein JW751_05620 [Polyangiaceae bacterium]|nr:hypothetical protein [Polyangiaceae bacterium]
MRDGDHGKTARAAPATTVVAPEDEPPVVARMVLEIRSDGTRTVARGAMEDVATGQRMAVAAEGTTPLALAAALARSMFSGPTLAHHAGRAVRALLQSRRRSG